jgi:hypothetical protein
MPEDHLEEALSILFGVREALADQGSHLHGEVVQAIDHLKKLAEANAQRER